MFQWALIFLVVALIAGVLGFGGIAGTSAHLAIIVFWCAVVLTVIIFILHQVRARGPRG